MYQYRNQFNPRAKHHIRNEEFSKFFSDIEKNQEKLMDWQIKQFSSFKKWYETYNCLTRKQYNSLKEIHTIAIKPLPKIELSKSFTVLFSKWDSFNGFERNFLESIKKQILLGKTLSSKQNEVLEKIKEKYSEENEKRREIWKEQFLNDPQIQRIWNIILEFYKDLSLNNGVSYYQNIVCHHSPWKNGSKDIPTREEYEKLCENKYSFSFIKTLIFSPPKYNVGGLAVLSANFAKTPLTRKYLYDNVLKVGTIVLIIKVIKDKLYSSTKDNQPYLVRPIGDARNVVVEQRNLKKVPKVK